MKDLMSILLGTASITTLIILSCFPEQTVMYKQGFEAGKNYEPKTMKMIDSLQGLTPFKKAHALDRLSKMGTDSVEMIINRAGF